MDNIDFERLKPNEINDLLEMPLSRLRIAVRQHRNYLSESAIKNRGRTYNLDDLIFLALLKKLDKSDISGERAKEELRKFFSETEEKKREIGLVLLHEVLRSYQQRTETIINDLDSQIKKLERK